MSKQPQPPSALCEQTQEAIIALLDNEYVPEQQALLAKHLPECPSCQAYQDSMQHLTLSLSQIDEVPVPEGLELRIMDRIAEESTQPGTRQTVSAGTGPRRGKWLKAAPIAAARNRPPKECPRTTKKGRI